MYHKCASLCSLCVGKSKFKCHLLPLITGTKTNMLLIIFLGIFAKLAFVCGDCEVGEQEVKNFDFTKVGIIVSSRFLFLKFMLVFVYHLWFH